MVDRVLNGIYTLCGWLAALSLAMIAVLTLAQIVCRQLAIPLEMTELSGFCLAAATFFGLAHTLVSGDHVRVSLMEGIRSTRLRHLIEIWCCGIGAVVSLFATFGLVRFTIETYTYGDLSPGMMAVPLWMPQSLVSFGLALLALAFGHQLVQLLSGRLPGYQANEHEIGD